MASTVCILAVLPATECRTPSIRDPLTKIYQEKRHVKAQALEESKHITRHGIHAISMRQKGGIGTETPNIKRKSGSESISSQRPRPVAEWSDRIRHAPDKDTMRGSAELAMRSSEMHNEDRSESQSTDGRLSYVGLRRSADCPCPGGCRVLIGERGDISDGFAANCPQRKIQDLYMNWIHCWCVCVE
jgi:hypothetical protein